MKYKIEYERDGCIGAGSCERVAPKFFKLDEENKAVLSGAILNEETGKYELIIETEEDLEEAQNAVDGCPVSVIKVSPFDG